MYGRSSRGVVGSTGNRFFPPLFCQASNDRDLNLVIPTYSYFMGRSLHYAYAVVAGVGAGHDAKDSTERYFQNNKWLLKGGWVDV